ncbi:MULTISPECIES: replication-associated recombination protein A [Peptoniphilus]|uniref:replication-associated recombination protein A n=1 Tax=Peptoniphilus TaxID=162289 RepID=UPI0001DA9BFC|nr:MULTISPECIES: replication-associated recombination protein A [Peptoniphilus]EFI42185.1 ATPase, AAA family [Peptoniphilus sp. oral taxon 386 str. F0131]
MDLFTLNMQENLKTNAPLAERLRPKNLNEFFGQKHLVGEGRYLSRIIKSDRVSSMIFYGPPGVGKTTLARIIANTTKKRFVQISAVTSNIKELREVLNEAEEFLKYENKNTILFIDEIHRFNKTQQDALLPFVEKGIIILIGATTENPYFEVNKALVSRCQILTLEALCQEELRELIIKALNDENGFGNLNIEIDDAAINFLINNSSGDGRNILNSLEIAILSTDMVDNKIKIDIDIIKDCLQSKNINYDKNGNEHYDTASAFIKSIRGSDPNAALFYLAKMIESGEEPKFIARRLIISASEDISNADPMALVVAVAAFNAVNMVGFPEGRIILAQATTYLATAPKSNRAYLGINSAINDVKYGTNFYIPMYLRDKHSPDIKKEAIYKYPHDYENNYVEQQYLPSEFVDRIYYEPSNNGYEKKIKDFMAKLKDK